MGEGDADDWRRLKACPGCDYSLETLPAEGTCPECGRRYDQRFVVLTGQGRGRWDTAAGGTWRGTVGQFVWIAALLWVFAGGRGFANSDLVIIGVLGGATLATQLYARLFSAREPRMQLWLSPEGVAQVPSTPEARRALSIGEGLGLLIVPAFWVALLMDGGGRIGWIPLTVITAIMAVGGLAQWGRWRRMGRADGADYVPGLWRWGAIERIQVKVLPGGRSRFRCMVLRKWWRIHMGEEWVINIEVECPEAAAEAIGRQMVEWCPKAAE
jgi:hypothetical protein